MAGAAAWGADWPQYRGPASDGSSTELIAPVWVTNRPGFAVWTNSSLTNGFSSFAVSQGRAFTLMSKNTGGTMLEYCVGLNADTGTNLWATPIGPAPWNLNDTGNGGAGTPPYNKGDGPRTTPSVRDGRVFALSAFLRLVCMNATNGSVIWSNNLVTTCGASVLAWENGASPCLDDDLIFVSLNSSTDSRNLAAFRAADGGVQWRSQAENATHSTPVVCTIDGVRQVVFATKTGLVSLDRSTGAFLWKFTYPFGSIGTSLGASPVIHSNIVYCTGSYYGKGAAAARVALSNNTWTTAQLYWKTGAPYESIWMTPICYQGHIYTLSGTSTTFLNQPLACIELTTGTVKWTTNGFGKGGIILVNTNLLALTEKGELVLFDPNPAAYTERARYQALRFNSSAPGKCWNNPAFSNGRIYARGTRGAVCLDVAVPAAPPLKLLSPQFLNRTQLQLTVGTADGTPIQPDRVPRIEVRATNALGSPASAWPKLTNQLVLTTNGLVALTNTLDPAQPRQFYRAMESP